ncbi:MAG: hypothetical protein JWP91_1503 [Fibrobacteres bacterium]|nr:hypothetical protein [Fibrobacterota bacterium]
MAFDKVKLDDNSNDACTFGDFNKDGRMDLACADAWYEAPAWAKHVFRANRQDDMLLAMDVDGDGWTDLIAGAHGDGVWYRNNGLASGNWAMAATGCLMGHSGELWDIDGDGKRREILSDVADEPTVWSEYSGGAWVCHTISTAKDNWGAGVGDVNGDGRADIIRPNVWYEAPADRRAGGWIPHAIAIGAIEDRPALQVQELPFVERIHEIRNSVGQHGHTAQIYAMDVNGDGLNDLIAGSAHRMGTMWYEQIRKGTAITFKSHVIDGELSILHCLHLADMDRDGDMDLVTAKRWRGHGKDEDPFTETPLFVVWYEFTKGRAPYWKRHFVTHGEGITAGTQIGVGDYDKDGDSDLVVINVRADNQGGGPWLFTNKLGQGTKEDEGPGPGKAVAWRKWRLDSLPALAAAFGDFNGDGKADIAAGDHWYESPMWIKHRFRAMEGSIDAQGNGSWKQDGTLSAMDVDEDGRIDLIAGSRQAGLLWYRNAGSQGNWPVTIVDPSGNYETGGLWDLDNDGKRREILSSAEAPAVRWWDVKAGKWTAHAVAADTCNLGAGAGDLNGDGKADLIRPNAWYQAPAAPGGAWVRHELAIGALDDRPFGEPVMAFPHRTPAGPDWLGRNAKGAHGHTSRIFTYDVNKDGRMDIITGSAHRVGISWWEQLVGGGFEQHVIDAGWSQAHALGFADVDGDGDPDLVTGKDFKAEGNGENDPMPDGELQVVWYELDPGKAFPWIKHVISAGEGIGAGGDLDLADFDGDGDLDLAVTGKNGGPWLFENRIRNPVSIAPEARGLRGPGVPVPKGLRFDGERLILVDLAGGRERARDVSGKILWTEAGTGTGIGRKTGNGSGTGSGKKKAIETEGRRK